MNYWITDISCCPKDSHKLIKTDDILLSADYYGHPARLRILGYYCPRCHEKYYEYAGAETAVESDIFPDFLSDTERQNIDLAKKKKKERVEKMRVLQDKAKKEQEEIEKQQAQQRRKEGQERERQLLLQRLEEKKKQAELIAKKEVLTEYIKFILEMDYMNSAQLIAAANSENLFSESEIERLRETFIANWFSEHMQDAQSPG